MSPMQWSPMFETGVKEIDDQTLLTLALVENLQRADLNPIEEAEGHQRLIAEFALTQQQVADVVGKDRSTVANCPFGPQKRPNSTSEICPCPSQSGVQS